jgi:hypothetical protein
MTPYPDDRLSREPRMDPRPENVSTVGISDHAQKGSGESCS